MDLSTTYLGLKLKHPFMAGASPLAYHLDTVRRLEDAGASAIVMHSLFEEQVIQEEKAAHHHVSSHEFCTLEASTFLPPMPEGVLGPTEYLERIQTIKSTVEVPVIASLNGVTQGGWMRYAALMEGAGADALELNVYHLSTQPRESGQEVEERLVRLVKAVKSTVQIPVAVKLSPFFSSLPALCSRLANAGAAGMVIFNRFYQPDIDIENLEMKSDLKLSDSSELLLRLRWLAILSAAVEGVDFACTGGVHNPVDAVKAVMCGACTVQLVSALLHYGPEHLAGVIEGFGRWMEEHEYESVAQMRGCMNYKRCPDPSAVERSNYMRVLMGWSVANTIPAAEAAG